MFTINIINLTQRLPTNALGSEIAQAKNPNVLIKVGLFFKIWEYSSFNFLVGTPRTKGRPQLHW